MSCNSKKSKPVGFQFLRPACGRGVWPSSNKYPAAVREGLPGGLAEFICLDSLGEGGMLSGHVYFHSRYLMVVYDLINTWYLGGRSLNRIEYLPRASIKGLVR